MRSPRTTTNSGLRSLQLGKACVQQRRPNAAKNKNNKIMYKKYIKKRIIIAKFKKKKIDHGKQKYNLWIYGTWLLVKYHPRYATLWL